MRVAEEEEERKQLTDDGGGFVFCFFPSPRGAEGGCIYPSESMFTFILLSTRTTRFGESTRILFLPPPTFILAGKTSIDYKRGGVAVVVTLFTSTFFTFFYIYKCAYRQASKHTSY